ncbi:hypothetical protein F4779DRAFT_537533 [Xylariaceae sp. FL0662B]|nr:hypothetical protein F4779DRAFT_537533 [Xylariaceae sp. FL0662B]
MALDSLADKLQDLDLSEPACLLFCPTGEKAWLRGKFNDIPRYLFRVFALNSDGATNRFWTKSKAARHGHANGRVDILTKGNNEAADMLNGHLRWSSGDGDNLVSWTSSLLFALQYMFYLNTESRDRPPLNAIFLCVIDTTNFPKGVFLRDIDLIDAYASFNEDLEDFKALRSRKRYAFSGSFYFGEYLSQGALKIENECQIVSAQDLVDKGLKSMQPQLGPPGWPYKVIEIREAFYKPMERDPITTLELRAVSTIAEIFEPQWRIPVAANLIALRPRTIDDRGAIIQTLRGAPFLDCDWRDTSPSRTKIATYDTLPEVEQFGTIMHTFYRDSCLMEIQNCLKEGQTLLEHADDLLATVNSQENDLAHPSPNFPSLDSNRKAVSRQLDILLFLAKPLLQLSGVITM